MKFASLVFLSSFISYIYAFKSSCSKSGEQCLHVTQCPLKLQKVVENFKIQSNETKNSIYKMRCGKEMSKKLCCKPPPPPPPQPECYTWDGRPGVCVKVDPATINTSHMTPSQIMISRCYKNEGPYLCQSDLPVTQSENCEVSAFPSDPSLGCCGMDRMASCKKFRGDGITIDQYPWLAVLKYDQDNKTCSGVLISNRYILTAAHCVDYSSAKPYAVVLGEYDKRTKNDCDFYDECHNAADEVTIGVEEIVVHEDFSPTDKYGRHDIALIRLMKHVTYSDFIQPICLPSSASDITMKPPRYFNLWSAGWGNVNATYRSPSDVKRRVRLSYVEPIDCLKKVSRVWSDQMCAAGVTGGDNCIDESGSPLMYFNTTDTAEVLGITGPDITSCTSQGTPAVYTKVYSYIQWIHTHIRP